MNVLALEEVSKCYREGQLERAVLREVTLELDAGELAMVWGLRGSGRSTLLRLAAGIEAPDTGTVSFEGHDLASGGANLLGSGIAYCQKTIASDASQTVLDVVIVSLLARGTPQAQARSQAREALERAGAEQCATMRLFALEPHESVRVALARVLALSPRLLIIDDPIQGVDLLERDQILSLLRSLADGGLTVLASTGDSAGLSGADRTLTLSDGVLRGLPAQQLAPVLPLRRATARRAGA